METEAFDDDGSYVHSVAGKAPAVNYVISLAHHHPCLIMESVRKEAIEII